MAVSCSARSSSQPNESAAISLSSSRTLTATPYPAATERILPAAGMADGVAG
jgi:hypothetical protein